MIKRFLSLIKKDKVIVEKDFISSIVFYLNGNKYVSVVNSIPAMDKDNKLIIKSYIAILPGSYNLYQRDYKVEDLLTAEKKDYSTLGSQIADKVIEDFKNGKGL